MGREDLEVLRDRVASIKAKRSGVLQTAYDAVGAETADVQQSLEGRFGKQDFVYVGDDDTLALSGGGAADPAVRVGRERYDTA